MMVKAIIFDMDGVITNTMPDHYKAWNAVFGRLGFHLSHLEVYSREGQPGIMSVQELFMAKKIPLNKRKARLVLERKEKLFKRIVRQRFIRGSRRFLRSLHRRQFKLALVTGTSRREAYRILPEYLFRLFDVVVTGNDVKEGKPHPEPFLKALGELSCKPKEVVVIENAPFGIQSAKKAGLKCLALETSLHRRYLRGADAVFATVSELQEKIEFVVSP